MRKFKATMYNTRGVYPIIVHVHGEAKDWIEFVKKARLQGKNIWPTLLTNEMGVTDQQATTRVVVYV